MIYEYHCPGCAGSFDIVKPAAEYLKDEFCPTSGTTMTRAVAPTRIFLNNTQVQERVWQPAIGKAATTKELREEAKRRGMIEVGTERPEKHLSPPRAEYPTFSNDEIRALTSKS